jgi:hypothetical protein
MFGEYWQHVEESGSNFPELPCLDEEKTKTFLRIATKGDKILKHLFKTNVISTSYS